MATETAIAASRGWGVPDRMDEAAGVAIAVGSGLGDDVGDGDGDGVGACVAVSDGVADGLEPEGEALDR